MSWSACRCFAIQLSKIKLAHSSASLQVRKHTFKASGACNGREVLPGTPNAPKKLYFEGKPRSRRRAHERSEVAARSRERRHGISPPKAADCHRQSRADQPLTRAANECRLKGGIPKTPPHPSPCGATHQPFFLLLLHAARSIFWRNSVIFASNSSAEFAVARRP